jgi:formate-dependent phosphoribosylglycinamide formyltransferase (GAR transformylase)
MTQTKHTPGPWIVRIHAATWGTYTIQPFAERQETAEQGDQIDALAGEDEANVRLIAAAPAQRILLDLLRYGLTTLSDGDLEMDGVVYAFDDAYPDWTAVVNAIGWAKATAAIAKATGQKGAGQ